MHALGIVAELPNVFSYTSVINACATTYGDQDEKRDAFRTAYSSFKELSEAEHLTPNHVTYSTFMRAVSKLMPYDTGEKKDAIVSAAFRLCIRDGSVDSNCLFHMKSAATPELAAELLGCSDPIEAASLTVEELPQTWTCNVKGHKGRKR